MFIGVDIGTSSSKCVVANTDGVVVASAIRQHRTSSPQPGWFEHDAELTWWDDLRALLAEVLAAVPADGITAIGISGIGPCVLITDRAGKPLRPAILYGIDTRAEREITELTLELGEEEVLARCGNRLTTQAVAPKLRWLARHEPDAWHGAERWYCASNWLIGRLTGEYVVDHYTASTSDCLYDLLAGTWWPTAWTAAANRIEQPRLVWPGEVVGEVSQEAAAETGLRAGTLVLGGTIDALAEAYSAGCTAVGDTMVMYGSTSFFVQFLAKPVIHPGLWAATGREPGSYAVAAGLATSGLVGNWLAGIAGAQVAELVAEAATVPAGSGGLVLLPYFAGERTPLFDPRARGLWIGLTLGHTRAHLYRSVFEGVAYGVRHNIEAMAEAGASPRRLVAVGGGTQGNLWTRITSDVTGLPQDLPSITIGASYGDARMAADACGVSTATWNPVSVRLAPDPGTAERYGELYAIYRHSYQVLAGDMHQLAALSP